MAHKHGIAACVSLHTVTLLGARVALAQAGNDIETIVVTGTQGSMEAAAVELATTPGGASLIDMEDLRERNVGSLADALRYVPGIWSASDTGNDGMFFSSRGSNLDATDWDMNGIKLMQDGLPVTTADGNNHNRIIDPLAARYATVARGANALSYGASTLGGAVNFVTPTAHDGPLMDISLNAGSHGQALGRLSLGEVFTDTFDGMLTLEAKAWDGYREHNEQNRGGIYGNLGWRLSDGLSTRFYATVLDNDQELPGSLSRAQLEENSDQASEAAVYGNYQLEVETRRLANKTSWQISGGRLLEFGVSIEEQTLYHPIVWVGADFDGPGGEPPVEFFSLLIDTDHRDVGTMLRYNHQIGAHDLVLGFNYGENQAKGGNYRNLQGRPNGLSTIVDNDASTLEVFAMDRWRLGDRTTLTLAAQGVSADREVRSTNAGFGASSNPSDSYSSINPRLGVMRVLSSNATVYGNLSRLFEPPTNFELEDNVLGGSATLDAMKGTVFEIGTRGERGFGSANRWSWDVNLYYAEIDDEILSVEDPDAPGTSLVTNVDKTVHAGLEAVFSSTFVLNPGGTRMLQPLVSLTVNDFSFDGDPSYGNNELPAAPKYFVRGEVIYRAGNGFYVGPTFDIVGDRYADFANAYTVDSYGLLGLRAGWSNDRWRVFAELRNLEDEVYVVSHGVRNVAAGDDAILNAGEPLSGYFGIQMQLE
jgi:iron complex outermembrane receptor protein